MGKVSIQLRRTIESRFNTLKIVTIVGARPQFIKCAPVSRALRSHVNEILVHTGQHYDDEMSRVFFDELKLPHPDYNLGIRSSLHGAQTGQMLVAIEDVLLHEAPEGVVVYGDTNSTLAGALAAVKLQIPLFHIEAGLRSYNRQMPEEHNRVITDHCSDVLFCPTATAVDNLMHEGFQKRVNQGDLLDGAGNLPLLKGLVGMRERPLVIHVGDVMYDAFHFNRELAERKSSILEQLGLSSRPYGLATVHRQENTDHPENLQEIVAAFETLAHPEMPIVVPLHPRTKKKLMAYDINLAQSQFMKWIPPVSYLDMLQLVCHAKVVLTDSGGLQKEAFFARVPCISLRKETEWVETVTSGWNLLAGAQKDMILKSFQNLSTFTPSRQSAYFGNGQSSETISSLIKMILSN